MNKLVHNISIRVFEKDPDKINYVKNGFKELLPINYKKEKIHVKHQKAEGFNNKIIHILSIQTSKRKHNRLLLNNILNNLSKQDKKRIYGERETRIDAEGNFYLRLDKQSLLNEKYKITESGDCFHITIKLAAYPSTKENTLESLRQIFDNKN